MPGYFYVTLDGEQAGPAEASALSKLWAQKEVDAETLVWKKSMSNWTAIADIPELLKACKGTPALPGGSKPPALPKVGHASITYLFIYASICVYLTREKVPR